MTAPTDIAAREAELRAAVAGILRDVCELPDRSSPDDEPDMVLVTLDELDLIARRAIEDFADHHAARADRAEAKVARLRERLTDTCAAMEYWAGCDEGVSPDAATSEIMSSGGAWPAQSYDLNRAALARIGGE